MTHGTLGAYTNHGCRCDICQQAWAVYQRQVRAVRRAKGQCRDCRRAVVPGGAWCVVHRARKRRGDRQWDLAAVEIERRFQAASQAQRLARWQQLREAS